MSENIGRGTTNVSDMQLILRIVFDTRSKVQIDIENPPYVPNIGDVVNINPEEYLTDIEDINYLNEYRENGIWLVGLKTITYEKNVVIVFILLEEEENFKESRKL